MKINPTLLLGVFCVTCAASAIADPLQGKLRVCRWPGLVEMADKQPIPIKSGAVFKGSPDKDGYPTTEIELKTTADATLPPKPGCTAVPVELAKDPKQEGPDIAKKKKFIYVSGDMFHSGPHVEMQAVLVSPLK